MKHLAQHDMHALLGASFADLKGYELVSHYGDVTAEYRRLRDTAGVLDLSFRGRLCLLGGDRVKFLHGQVTNDVRRLAAGSGCYSAITDHKGRVLGDVNIHLLTDEILLDFEPGQTAFLQQHLQHFIVADDVELCDVADAFGLLSVQGPAARSVIDQLEPGVEPPERQHDIVHFEHTTLGPLYLANHPRLSTMGFDLYCPVDSLPALFDKLLAAAGRVGGGPAGWAAFEPARVEAGIPRFGPDMGEANLAPEAGLDERAISYTKGCYVGQEVLNRLHNFAHVNKRLRPLRFSGERCPLEGDALSQAGAKAGYVTSVVTLPDSGERIGLGYVRRDFDAPSSTLVGDGFLAQIRQTDAGSKQDSDGQPDEA
jgi:folate-binding protein YgfZ